MTGSNSLILNFILISPEEDSTETELGYAFHDKPDDASTSSQLLKLPQETVSK